MTYIIAVCNQKGGVAKTTTVSALGAAFAAGGYPTLLIDLDPSANLTAGMGFSPRQVRKSAADLLLGNETLTALGQPTAVPGLDLIPSGPGMDAASQLIITRPQHESVLRRAFTVQRLPHDFVIIDCPPSMASITTASLAAADLGVIPAQCEYFALQAVGSTFNFIRQVRAKYNPGLRYRILVTMFDRRGKLHTQLYEKLRMHYGEALFNTVIGFDSKLRSSQIAGQPITVFAPKTRAARQYRELAQEIVTLSHA
jgi:chromosome partitioning protein